MEDKNKHGGSKPANKQEKLSYEKLNQMAGDLYQQNQQLIARMKQMQAALDESEFNRQSFFLSMLFKVVEHSDRYKSDFVVWCVENIESALTSFADGLSSEEEKKEDANEA